MSKEIIKKSSDKHTIPSPENSVEIIVEKDKIDAPEYQNNFYRPI